MREMASPIPLLLPVTSARRPLSLRSIVCLPYDATKGPMIGRRRHIPIWEYTLPKEMSVNQAVLIDGVPGDTTGLILPAHAEALRSAGANFLTRAFQVYGSLSIGNRVTRINRFELCAIGSTGQKVLLSLEYARPEPRLPADLFVKFSRDFVDAFRDRRRGELASEIALCELSRFAGFPIRVPIPYFADFHRESGTGLLITERIPFGVAGIEPLRPKCMDHLLDRPLDYYRTIVTALGRLAAAHTSGALSPHVEALFPFNRQEAAEADPIPWDEEGLRAQVARYAAFAARCPRLLPAHIRSAEFIAQFARDAVSVLRHQRNIKEFMHADPTYIALSHFNAHIDNAWFWRDARGALQCGLFDWQRGRQMNVAYALWGALCGAGLDIWNDHLDDLLRLFVAEIQAHGGPALDPVRLELYLHLYAATMGLAGLLVMPTVVCAKLPNPETASGPLDSVVVGNEAARSFLHIFTVLLNLWQSSKFRINLERTLGQFDQ
jgi:hypothetical protein